MGGADFQSVGAGSTGILPISAKLIIDTFSVKEKMGGWTKNG